MDFGNRRTLDTSVHERPSRPRRNSDTMEWTATKSSQFPEVVNRGAVKLGRLTSKLNVLDFGRVGPSPRTSEEKTEGQRTPPADPLAHAYRSKQDVENEKMERELARRLASQQPEVGTPEQVIEMRETFEDDPDLDERLVIYYGRFKGGTVHSIKLSATLRAAASTGRRRSRVGFDDQVERVRHRNVHSTRSWSHAHSGVFRGLASVAAERARQDNRHRRVFRRSTSEERVQALGHREHRGIRLRSPSIVRDSVDSNE